MTDRQTDGRAGGRRTTTVPIGQPLLKYGQLTKTIDFR